MPIGVLKSGFGKILTSSRQQIRKNQRDDSDTESKKQRRMIVRKQITGRKILALLCSLLLVVSCTACGGKGKEEAKIACENFFQAYSSCDSQALTEFMEGLAAPAAFTDIQRGMAKSLQFELKKVKSKGNTMVVSAVITAVDLQKVLESLPETADSKESAKEALAAALDAENVPTKEFEANVSLVQKDEKWAVKMTPELADALLGGYYSILKEAAEEVAP